MKPVSMLAVLAGGVLFGFGLSLSTMTRPEVVLSFLRLEDFGLMLVLGGAVIVTAMAYQFAPRLARGPLFEREFGHHVAELNGKTLGGSALFGIGWGLCGVCPGPAIAGLGGGNWPLLLALAGMLAGAWVQARFAGKA